MIQLVKLLDAFLVKIFIRFLLDSSLALACVFGVELTRFGKII
jgi:hypothetical protein